MKIKMLKSRKALGIFTMLLALIAVTSLSVWMVRGKGAKNNSEICVAYSTDENYLLPTLVAMTSLMENANKNTFCKFTVLISDGVSEEAQEKIKSVGKKYSNCSINIVNMGQQFDSSEVRCWSRAMYYRLNLPEILKDEKRCIYLDGDTIVRKDLSEMFNLDMSNYYIAGVRDINSIINKDSDHYKILEIPNLNSYVCSGVLIMNLEKMRNDNLDKTLEEIIKENDVKKTFIFPDQDALNKACYGHIFTLPFKYGALAHTGFEYSYKDSEYAQWASNKKDWDEGRKDPVVLHFTGEKPWNKNYSSFCQEWWKYADLTESKSEIHERYSGDKG